MLNNIIEEFSSIRSLKGDLSIIDDRCLCVPERNPDMMEADMVLYSTGHCKQIDFNGGGLAFYRKDEEFRIDSSLFYDGTDEEVAYKVAYKEGSTLRRIPSGWLKMENYLPPVEYMNKIELASKERVMQREYLNTIYVDNLPESIQMQAEFQNWRFNIRVPAGIKEIILRELFKNGLFASNHYHSVNRLFDNKRYSVSDCLFKSVINLFNDRYYTPEMAKKTCEIINEVLKQQK